MLWHINYQLQHKNPADRLKELSEHLFTSRGLATQKDIDQFLNPPQPDLSIIDSLKDLDQKALFSAIDHINQAITDQRPIIVYGDYDCDGVCATAILWQALYTKTKSVRPFIPSRTEHGYGLSVSGLKSALALFPGQKPLIITVDTGVTASDTITQFPDLDIIITDHHQIPPERPLVKHLIHTLGVSGAGVAWILASHFLKTPQPLDLLALATVCDLLPLLGPNRAFVKHGLKEIETTKRPGLVALKKIAGIENTAIDTYHLGFVLGPRINAAGRLGQGMDALRLLCTQSPSQADTLSQLLNETNSDRQYLTQKHTKSALDSLNALPVIPPLIVLDSPEYHEGIIGLIAGKIVEEFNHPCLVMSIQGDQIKGSARSPEGIDITSLLRQAGGDLIECGGHTQAAGLKMSAHHLPEFKKQLLLLGDGLDLSLLQKRLNLTTTIEESDITLDLLNLINSFSPFGMENPQPLFASTLTRLDQRLVGKDQNHLSLTLKHGQSKLSAIGFNQKQHHSTVIDNPHLDLAFLITQNTFNGKTSLQLQIKDLKPAKKL